MADLGSEGHNPQTDSDERRNRVFEFAALAAAGLAVALFAAYETGAPGRAEGAFGNVGSFFLINLNIVLLLVVIFMIGRNLTKLLVERRRGVLGSHLRSRLVFGFVAVAFFPGVLMVVFSYGFATGGIDDWLSDDIEAALDGAWDVAHHYYRDVADDSVSHAKALAASITREGALSELPDSDLRTLLTAQQRAFGLGAVQVVDEQGAQRVAVVAEGMQGGLLRLPGTELFAAALAGEAQSEVEGVGEGDVIRGVAPIYSSNGSVEGVVVVDAWVASSARRGTETIIEAFREFRQLRLGKRPLRNLYLITVGLAALVVVLAAIWLGILMARTITDPIGRLAAATRDVASGRWDVALPEDGSDELATLVRAFNAMTEDLRATHEDLESRRAYTENVLANIDAGVLSIGETGRIETINPAACDLLGLEGQDVVDSQAAAVLQQAGMPAVATLVDELSRGVQESGAQQTVSRPDAGLTLLVTATTLSSPASSSVGFVVFFENVTGIVEVQRMEAWREVARRIAHEIKNPLTPIQLSAQRLGRRLSSTVEGDNARVLDECVGTIVREVDGLKDLVNEFSNFARPSVAEKTSESLESIVVETLPLYRHARPDIHWGLEVEPDLPEVSTDREGVRRALVNLLDNAVGAVTGTDATDGSEPAVDVSLLCDRKLRRVVLTVADNGPGVAAADKARVFEPYFTSKTDGTGLGLAIVASMAADHQAYVRVADNQPRGARFIVEFPTATKEV